MVVTAADGNRWRWISIARKATNGRFGVGSNRTSSLSSWSQRVGDLSVDIGSVAVGLGSWTGWDVYVNGGDMA